MTRAVSGGERIEVKPTANVYTVLAIIAVLVNLICFVLMFMRWSAIFGDKNMFTSTPQ